MIVDFDVWSTISLDHLADQACPVTTCKQTTAFDAD